MSTDNWINVKKQEPSSSDLILGFDSVGYLIGFYHSNDNKHYVETTDEFIEITHWKKLTPPNN